MSRRSAQADVFAAIADPTRRRMLEMLCERECDASALGRPFRISQPSVSQHLRVLRQAGLVRARRAGRNRVYRLRPQPLKGVVDWVAHFEQFWDARLERLAEYLEKHHG
jgi:DNA-binding transcriptional ArsR family regulator